MIDIFKKTQYLDFSEYKSMIDRLDDIHFMNYVARKRMKN